MSWQEKREERFQHWLSPDVKFGSPEAGKLYKEGVMMAAAKEYDKY